MGSLDSRSAAYLAASESGYFATTCCSVARATGSLDAIRQMREQQARDWLQAALLTEFGTRGLALVKNDLMLADMARPFRSADGLAREFAVVRAAN